MRDRKDVEIARLRRLLKKRERELEAGRKLWAAFVSICFGCGKVHDAENDWRPLTEYLEEKIGLRCSHGLCPDCMKRLYTDELLEK